MYTGFAFFEHFIITRGTGNNNEVSPPPLHTHTHTHTHMQQKGITIEVTHTDNPRPKIHEVIADPKDIEFGKHFSDHMLLINWTKDGGWESPRITPFQNLSLSPALSALHYAIEVRG